MPRPISTVTPRTSAGAARGPRSGGGGYPPGRRTPAAAPVRKHPLGARRTAEVRERTPWAPGRQGAFGGAWGGLNAPLRTPTGLLPELPSCSPSVRGGPTLSPRCDRRHLGWPASGPGSAHFRLPASANFRCRPPFHPPFHPLVVHPLVRSLVVHPHLLTHQSKCEAYRAYLVLCGLLLRRLR